MTKVRVEIELETEDDGMDGVEQKVKDWLESGLGNYDSQSTEWDDYSYTIFIADSWREIR